MNHKEFSIWLDGFLHNKETLNKMDILSVREKLSKINEEDNFFKDNLQRFNEGLKHRLPNIVNPPIPRAPNIICKKDDK
jgi:hypothetical protein